MIKEVNLLFKIKEVLTQTYPSTIRFCHDIKYINGYLWLYMYGSLDSGRILKVNPNDLSDYTEIAITGSGKIVASLLYAKGFLWFPYEYSSMKIVRLNLQTYEYKIFEGIDCDKLTKPQVLLYIPETDEIWVSANEGFRIMDVSGDLNQPDWTPKNFRNYFTFPPSGTHGKLYNLHTGFYYENHVYYIGIDRTDEFRKSVGIIIININNPSDYRENGFFHEIGRRYTTDDSTCFNGNVYIGLEAVIPHQETEHIAKVNAATLEFIDSVSAKGIPNDVCCYGVFRLDEHIAALFATEPGIIKIYDQNFNEVGSYIFQNGFNKANEFCRIDDDNIFITFWDTNGLKISKIKIEKYTKNLIDGFDSVMLEGGLIR